MTAAPRLACTVRPWAQFPLERALAGIAEAGYDAVALPVHGVTEVITPYTPASQAREIGSVIRDHGLELVILSHAADLDRGDDVAVATLRRQLEHCHRLGVSTLVDMGCPELELGDRYLRLMATAAPYAAALGVTIAVKPHGGLTRTAADTRSVVEQVGHEAFRACWDPGNLVHYGGESPDRGLAELAPYIAAVGARDHPARGQGRPSPGGMPPAITPGDGIVDFVGLYRVLQAIGFTGPSAVESVTKLGTADELITEAARARKNLAAASLGRRTEARADSEGRPRASCSQSARVATEDPIGTARPFDRYLMLELPLPWPSGMGTPVWETDRVPARLRRALRAATRRVQERGLTMKTFAAAPDPAYSVDGVMRIIRFDRQPGAAAPLTRVEHHVPNELAPQLIEALFPADSGREAALLTKFADYREFAHHRDLVVCTHASVDACCGTYGYPFYRQLREAHGDDSAVRVWRISSFGGHRFAPTLVDFPDGRLWGNLTPDRMTQLVDHTGRPDELFDLYRGWACLAGPAEQAVERELLREYGWDWLSQGLMIERTTHTEYRLRITDFRTGATHTRFADIRCLGVEPILVGCDRTVGEIRRYSATLHPS
ncbi:TIM barrel protein [Mycolicibacterium sp.]|uniref:TIM barrel protein n=1 Tax=Mycolicibacterium sp. TaxID=2320850 RepID=UPI00355CA76F